MDPRKFALFGGIVMLVMGGVSLIPSLVGPQVGVPLLNLDVSYGLFMGYFPMNIVNKLALIAFGLAGIIVSSLKFTALPRSILYSRIVFFVMGAAAVLGSIPQTSTFYGYWPLFGGEVLAHAVFAVLGAYFGFALSYKVHKEIKTKPNLKTTFEPGR
jgi:Domain of unknown function (DUF4383)